MEQQQSYSREEVAQLQTQIVEQIRTVYDPEIPVNVYDLGLIYSVDVDEQGNAEITMTLTSPMCPVAETLPLDVQSRAESVDGVGRVDVHLVWEPQWTMDMMSEDAKLELGL